MTEHSQVMVSHHIIFVSVLKMVLLVSMVLLPIYWDLQHAAMSLLCTENADVKAHPASQTPHPLNVSLVNHLVASVRPWAIPQRSVNRKFAHRIKDYRANAKIMPAQNEKGWLLKGREQHHQQRSDRGRIRHWRNQHR